MEDQLVFEQPAVTEGKRREYRVLKLELQETEDVAQKKIHFDLKPSSKETMEVLNKLANEGFVVRDLFYSDALSLLLERAQ